MDTNLPDLEIQADLDVLAEDDTAEQEKPVSDEIKMEVVEVEEQEDPIFKKPKKVKKPPSEKQLAHLSRIRQLAAEKKALKAKAKADAMAKVNEEHKAKSYKPRKKSKASSSEAENKRIIGEVRTEQEQAYNEKTIAKEYIEPSKITPNESNTPDDFNKSHKEKVKKDKVSKEEEDTNSFMQFMSNMETYKKMKNEYKPKAPPRPKQVGLLTETKQIRQEPPSILRPPAPINPYADYFG